MSWKDTTTVTIPIHSVAISPTGDPVPLVTLPNVITLLKFYGVDVTSVEAAKKPHTLT